MGFEMGVELQEREGREVVRRGDLVMVVVVCREKRVAATQKGRQQKATSSTALSSDSSFSTTNLLLHGIERTTRDATGVPRKTTNNTTTLPSTAHKTSFLGPRPNPLLPTSPHSQPSSSPS